MEQTVVKSNTVSEKNELERRIEMLEKMLIASMNNKQVEEPKDKNDIRPDELIDVMSLIHFRLTLTTQYKGGGKPYKFEKFGEKRRILYSDLIDIMDVNQSFMEAGKFYILDKRVINKHGLNDLYENLLNKEKIEKVIECNDSSIIDVFKNATKKQQQIIGDMLTQKLVDGENLDLNIIAQIEKVGKISISKRADEIKTSQAIEE